MPFSRERFEVTQYLGNMVGKKDKFLNSIALMNSEWREICAFLEVPEILDKHGLLEEALQKDDKKKLDAIKEISQRIGQALFPMDVVSHLSMKIGKAYKIYDGE